MSAKSAPFLNKSHNFGIFLKKGKRGILQLDFPSQMMLMIQRGHIKKTQPFHSLLYFESEEDLHISLRFLDGDLDFEADTAEEKYTICRLLDLILEAENSEPINNLTAAAVSGGVPVMPRVPLVPHNVLKDGVLEKKGNTTITTWNRRRVKISAGEFAYFKPGEELALNVVHLRQDRCAIQRVGQNSLHLSVNQRLYCFRVPNDSKSGLSVEMVRDDWIKAFEQAMTMKRAISLLSPTSLLLPAPEEDDPGHQGDTETTDVSSIEGSPFVSRKTPLESFGQSLETGKPEITASVSVHFSYNNNNNHALSTIDPTTATSTTTFVNAQPPKPAKKATVYPFRRQRDKGSERHGGSGSDVVSRPHPDSLSDDLPVTALRAKFIGHNASDTDPSLIKASYLGHVRSTSLKESRAKKLNDRVLAFSDLSLVEDEPKILTRRDITDQGISPQIMTRRDILDRAMPQIQTKRNIPDQGIPKLVSKGGKTPSTEPQLMSQTSAPDEDSPGEVLLQSKKYAKERPSVLGIWKERDATAAAAAAAAAENNSNIDSRTAVDRWEHAPAGSKLFRDDTAIVSRRESLGTTQGLTSTGPDGNPPAVGGQCGNGFKKPLCKANSMSDLLDVKEGEKDVAVVVGVPKVGVPKAPPPPVCVIPPAPALAPPPPPLPPVGKSVGSKGGVKLKQVHWTPVDKKQISVSLWSEKKSHLPTFDLKLLEAMFSICEREGTVVNKNRLVKTTLVDGKRAQNLGILFCGVKEDSLTQLMDALSSVTELDNFQLQKMASLKRFQPTAEDMEMFRMYRQSRDSLTPVDRFMLDLCQIPKLSMRIDLVLALWDFPNNYRALAEEVDELLNACDQLLGSSSLPVVLRCLLALGNHLNAKRQSKDVQGFQVSSIDKMVDLKGREPDYSLMTYLVDQLQTTRPDLLDWTQSVDFLPKVAGYSVRAIGAEIDVMKNDLQKVKKYQKALKGLQGVHKKFQSDVQNFVLEYEKRMHTIHDKNDRLKHRFQQLLAWLGEPTSRTSDVLFSSLALLVDRFNTAKARLTT